MPCDPAMVEIFGVGVMIVMVALVIGAVYVLMKFFEEREGAKDIELQPPVANPVQTLPPEEEFIITFTKPMLQDGAGLLDDAIEAIKLGCSHYEYGAYVEASDEFHGSLRTIDEAADNFKEVLNDVENQASPPALKAKKLLGDCDEFRAAAKRMESACDAMVEGKTFEAGKLASGIEALKKKAAEWKP